MRVLYVGHATAGSTSRHRADAVARLGHDVVIADPYVAFVASLGGRLSSAFHYRTGYRFLQQPVCEWVEKLLQQYAGWPDLIWMDSGELLGVGAVQGLRRLGRPVVLFNVDDPTGKRDGRRFDSLLAALPQYDLCVVVREPSVNEFYACGAKRVRHVWRSYDEVAHRPFDNTAEIPRTFRSEVAFVGTWIRGEGRDTFLMGLIERGVEVSIWGERWQKSPAWKRLQKYWRGPGLKGRDYVAAIQGAKLTLGLLSHANRDLHTTRSAEIPYAGGLLCAERTSEHLAMYREGEEAVLWSDVDECAAVCHKLLADSALRERIRSQGMTRVRQAGFGNEAVCGDILKQLELANRTS